VYCGNAQIMTRWKGFKTESNTNYMAKTQSLPIFDDTGSLYFSYLHYISYMGGEAFVEE